MKLQNFGGKKLYPFNASTGTRPLLIVGSWVDNTVANESPTMPIQFSYLSSVVVSSHNVTISIIWDKHWFHRQRSIIVLLAVFTRNRLSCLVATKCWPLPNVPLCYMMILQIEGLMAILMPNKVLSVPQGGSGKNIQTFQCYLKKSFYQIEKKLVNAEHVEWHLARCN